MGASKTWGDLSWVNKAQSQGRGWDDGPGGEDLSWAVVEDRGLRDRGSGLDATSPFQTHKKLHKEQPEGRPISPVPGSHQNIQSLSTRLSSVLPCPAVYSRWKNRPRVCCGCDVGSYRATRPELHKCPRGKKMPQFPLVV